jgi:hypothetical protein
VFKKNVIIKLLLNDWKSRLRKNGSRNGFLFQIFFNLYAILAAIPVIYFLWHLKYILLYTTLNKNFENIIFEILIYIILIDFILRLFIQKQNSNIIQPYLTLNIRKSKIIIFFILQSIATSYNFILLVLLIPSILKNLNGLFNTPEIVLLYTYLFIFFLIINFFVQIIKNSASILLIWICKIVSIFFLIYGIIFHTKIQMYKYAIIIFKNIVSNHVLLLLLLIALFTVSIFYRNQVSQLLYIDRIDNNKMPLKSFLKNKPPLFSKHQLFILFFDLELKLIVRNNRPLQIIVSAIIFPLILLIGTVVFVKYTGISRGDILTTFLISIGAIALPIIFYGQFLFSWQSSHFPIYFVLNLKNKEYIKSKLLILFMLCTLAFLMCLIIWQNNITIITCSYFFNVGIQIPMICLFGMFNYQRLDVNKSAFLNHQGTGMNQYIYFYSLLTVSFIIFYPLYQLISLNTTIIIFGLFGITSICFFKQWLQLLTKQFNKNKYKLLEGFSKM